MAVDQATLDEHLLVFIERGDIKGVSEVLKQGADARKAEDDGWTPLHLAVLVRLNRPEIIDLLLQNGADINAQDKTGLTPLHRASGASRFSSIKTLIERGADISIVNEDGQTALDLAVRDKEFRELIDDLNARKEKERQALERRVADKQAAQEHFNENIRKLDALLGSRRPRRS